MTQGTETISENQQDATVPQPVAGLRRQVWPAIVSVPLLTIVTGIGFPLVLAVLARPLFSHQADGSLVSGPDGVVGSELIGQNFSEPRYFHPRPSAAGKGYDATASSGTNLGPSNPQFRDDVRQLLDEYRRRNDLPSDTIIPIDAVTRSGSGLDPHISPANALLQVPRIARARGLNEDRVRELLAENTQQRQLGFLGQGRVSVLALNLALDRIAPE
jgi:K+-transporting ATPase ATPase C chain